jgi:hypothetical protein
MACALRAQADGLEGPEKAYALWLAAEWDKAAARYGGPRPDLEGLPAVAPPRSWAD